MRPLATSALGGLLAIAIPFLDPLPSGIVAARQAAEPYQVVVSAGGAEVAFPIQAQDQWEWGRPETVDLFVEYRWTATVENRGQQYTFGFFLHKGVRSGPGKGNLEALLRAGQFGVTLKKETGGEFLGKVKVEARITANQLVIVVVDPATLRLLFSERPAVATLTARHPADGLSTRIVPITYQ